MKHINFSGSPLPIGPYSQAVLHNDILYCSGQIALDGDSGRLIGEDLKSQTKQIFSNIDKILNFLGLGKSKIIRLEVFITDMTKFHEYNEACSEYFKDSENYPARYSVEVSGLPKGALIEIACIVNANKES